MPRRMRLLGKRLIEPGEIELRPLKPRPSVFVMVGRVDPPNKILRQPPLLLEPRKRLKRRFRNHAAEIEYNRLDHATLPPQTAPITRFRAACELNHQAAENVEDVCVPWAASWFNTFWTVREVR